MSTPRSTTPATATTAPARRAVVNLKQADHPPRRRRAPPPERVQRVHRQPERREARRRAALVRQDHEAAHERAGLRRRRALPGVHVPDGDPRHAEWREFAAARHKFDAVFRELRRRFARYRHAVRGVPLPDDDDAADAGGGKAKLLIPPCFS
ncbi:hypothetical protein ACP70R_029818 [Stipagrostis hirtigluma subsp. patula]